MNTWDIMIPICMYNVCQAIISGKRSDLVLAMDFPSMFVVYYFVMTCTMEFHSDTLITISHLICVGLQLYL